MSVADESAIELHGALTLAELTRFQYFHTWRRTWPLAIFIALIWLLLPILIFAALAEPSSGTPDTSWRAVLTNAAPFFVLMLLWTFIMGVLPYRNARKQLRAQPYLGEPMTHTFTTEKISASGASTSWSIGWSTVRRVTETKSLFITYHGLNLGVIIPKRLFQTPAQMDAWRKLIVAAAPPKRIDKPGVVGRWC